MARPHPALLALPLLLAGADCRRNDPPAPAARPETRVDQGVTVLSVPVREIASDGPLLLMQLQDGDAPGGRVERAPVANPKPLAPARQDALLARLDALPTAERMAFRQRPDTRPPPKPGEAVDLPFPPPPSDVAAPDATDDAPLAIVRVTPDGEVPVLPRLTIQFNRAVVPLTTQDEAARTVPVSLDPTPEGAWRWIGTDALVFEPTGQRMPMATTYDVTLPADDEAPTGARVDQAQSFTVSTPPLAVSAMVPQGGPQPLQPVLAMTFDQRVDADRLAAMLQVTAGGTQVAVRPASSAEIAADPRASLLLAQPKDDRWLAVIPAEPLPKATAVSVTLPKGAPSAEGPRPTTRDQSFSLRTFDVLAVEGIQCTWNRRDPCRPGMAWSIETTNPLDVKQDLASLVTVDPPVDDLRLSVSGDRLVLQGATRAETTYTVTVGAGLTDVFEQSLGAPATLTQRVGPPAPAWPQILGPGGPLVVPDPADPAAVTFHAIGIPKARVRVSRMTDPDLNAWRESQRHDWGETPKLPGTVLLDETRSFDDTDTWSPVRVDLSAFDGPDVAGLVVQVETPKGTKKDDMRYERAWVVPTHLSIAAMSDARELVAWVTDARTGQGVAGAEIAMRDASGALHAMGTTDELGLARAPLTHEGILIVRHEDDLAWLTASESLWSGGRWTTGMSGVATLFHVFDDRHLYRPSETVHVKGWARRVDLGEGGDLLPPEGLAGPLTWTLHDAQGVELGKGSTTLDALGGFALDLALPDTPNLGPARLELRGAGGVTYHTFSIREFRRPTFEVSANVEDEGPFVLGDAPTAAVSASYLAGGPLPGADVTWQVTATPASWRPPGWDRFDFDPDVAWWWWRGDWFGGRDTARETHRGTTDATGTHRLRIGLLGAREARTISVSAQATVQDVDRQTFSSTAALLAHPAARAVGLRPGKPFYEQDEDVIVEVVVTDLQGEAVAGVPVKASLVRTRPRWDQGTWTTEEVERLPCETTSGGIPVACTFRPKTGGSWQIEATITDEEGRRWHSADRVWIAGGEPLPQAEGVDVQQVVLTPDAETYQPGDTAKILVTAPFAPADARISWHRSGIVHTETRRLETASTTIEVPIEAGMTPDLTVQVAVSGTRTRDGDREAPIYGFGSVTLAIPPTFRALDVEVRPAATEVSPGERTSVSVIVTHDGEPVRNAQVAVVMVDEAVLALTNTRITDPLVTFHPARGAGSREVRTWGWIRLAQPLPTPERDNDDGVMLEAEGTELGGAMDEVSTRGAVMRKSPSAPAPMADMAMAVTGAKAPAPPTEPGGPPIAVRSDFRADAVWVPAATTDAYGKVQIPVHMPDSLTRYRLTAVAVDEGRHFGLGETTLTSRLPLQVRPSLPRFLNVGDQAELPFLVHNRTSAELTVELAVQADNITMARGDRDGAVVVVPPDDRVEVRFSGTTLDAGEIVLQAAAATARHADAAQARFPVLTPATREGFATYGELSGADGTVAVKQALHVPDDVWPQFGGLDISTSTTRLSALTDAVIAIHDYPFGCSEQLGSRVLTTAALREVLDAFDAEGLPDKARLDQEVGQDLEELARRRNRDGGWPWWQRGRPSDAFLTLHVTHALWRAKDAGFDVDTSLLADALRRADDDERFLPPWVSEQTRQVVRAYAVYVQELGGLKPDALARRVWRDAGTDLPLTALGWILPTLDRLGDTAAVAAIEDHLTDRVTETARTAQFTTSWSEAEAAVILHGDRRTDGVLLETWLRVWPEQDRLPGKLVEGLLGGRSKGHWGSTQDNAWVLLALQKYFRVKEAVPPDLVARAWVGQALVAEHAFRGRTTEQASVRVPLSWLVQGRATDDLVVAREGKGRMYWRLGLRYAPKDLMLPPAEHGFSVQRTYEAIDDPEDVRQESDGTWVVKAGARVRVRLWMNAPARRYHVALVDPLPAGFEPLDPALVGTQDTPPGTAEPSMDIWNRGWWWGPWYEHENLRDDRVEAFARTVWPGVHTYSYTARATTPGRYTAMPTRAEEMYSPETFGRAKTEKVVVE